VSLPHLDVLALLQQFGVHPDKSLGQNFLVDETALAQVIDAAQISPQDTILEVGPGIGNLTRLLAHVASRVIVVELDSRLLAPLKYVVRSFQNVEIVSGDILSLEISRLVLSAGYLVVANIPYNITSALIRHLLESPQPPRRLVLTIQREVAHRICAQPGNMSLLALSVQVYGRPQIIAHIPTGAFFPPPKVDSSIIRIELYNSPLIPLEVLDTFFQLVKAGFSQKRKTLRNALSAGLHLSPPRIERLLTAVNIDPMRRAETLSIAEWHLLTEAYLLLSGDQSQELSPNPE
jgi:16S rRNA (adenine1518-N6/adenine1519-N6)-dimethyltransferase